MHIRNRVISPIDLFNSCFAILLDPVKPFIDNPSNRARFDHWHYLIEPDVCRGQGCFEIRLRFEGTQTNIVQIRNDFAADLDNFVNRNPIAMRISEPLGSHEGCHGLRGGTYLGAQSENFGRDWNTIVEILEKGSENALNIFSLGTKLVEQNSLVVGEYGTAIHPRYIHLTANQLLSG